jgi:hypothetical protein
MVQNRQLTWDLIYTYINIFINSLKIINGPKICYVNYGLSMYCYGCCEYIKNYFIYVYKGHRGIIKTGFPM